MSLGSRRGLGKGWLCNKKGRKYPPFLLQGDRINSIPQLLR